MSGIAAWTTWLLLGSAAWAAQEEAERFFAEENWGSAASAYRALVENEPENGRAWLRLGISLEGLGRYTEALEAMRKAEELSFLPPLTRFRIARCQALAGNREDALLWLERAVEAGYSSPESILSEPSLETLRDEPRFEQSVARARRNAEPCEHIPEFRQLDFWIGEWEVESGGQKAGTNRIEKLENGCLLLENWTSATAGTGKSVNFYDGVTKRWNQVWVDSSGTSIVASGGLRDAAMHFEGDHHYPDGSREKFRMSFTPREDGTVRQLIEQSRDQGKTWYVWFDGLYRKK